MNTTTVHVRPAWGADAPPLSARAAELLVAEWRELGLLEDDDTDPQVLLRGVQERAATTATRDRQPDLKLVTTADPGSGLSVSEAEWPTFEGRLLRYGETAIIGKDSSGHYTREGFLPGSLVMPQGEPPLLNRGHERTKVVGHLTGLTQVGDEVHASGIVVDTVTDGHEGLELARSGSVRCLSVEFLSLGAPHTTVTREATGGQLVEHSRVLLVGVGLVPQPAYGQPGCCGCWTAVRVAVSASRYVGDTSPNWVLLTDVPRPPLPVPVASRCSSEQAPDLAGARVLPSSAQLGVDLADQSRAPFALDWSEVAQLHVRRSKVVVATAPRLALGAFKLDQLNVLDYVPHRLAPFLVSRSNGCGTERPQCCLGSCLLTQLGKVWHGPRWNRVHHRLYGLRPRAATLDDLEQPQVGGLDPCLGPRLGSHHTLVVESSGIKSFGVLAALLACEPRTRHAHDADCARRDGAHPFPCHIGMVSADATHLGD